MSAGQLCSPEPSAVVGGRNMDPRLAQKTTPRPMANGPPQVRNLSLGAQAATVERPPTMPAVYQAARVRMGPPAIYVDKNY
jgi:hypothetical protein